MRMSSGRSFPHGHREEVITFLSFGEVATVLIRDRCDALNLGI
jgi:hypothetical protein